MRGRSAIEHVSTNALSVLNGYLYNVPVLYKPVRWSKDCFTIVLIVFLANVLSSGDDCIYSTMGFLRLSGFNLRRPIFLHHVHRWFMTQCLLILRLFA